MRRVTINQFNYEPDLKTFVGHPEAIIELEAGGLINITGKPFYAEIPAKDLLTGQSLRLRDDPLRWSELIADTLTYGDIEVAVEDVQVGQAIPLQPESAAVAIEALAAQVHAQ